MKSKLPVKNKDSVVVPVGGATTTQKSANDKKGVPTPAELGQPIKV